MPSNLDEIDIKILNYLQLDTRITNKELSDKACVTVKTLNNRIKRLIDAGYIKGYSVELDLNKVGKTVIAFTNIALERTSPKSITMFMDKMKSIPEVVECCHVNGIYDFILRIVVTDLPEYHVFIATKLSISGIKTIKSDIVLRADRSIIDLSNLPKKSRRT